VAYVSFDGHRNNDFTNYLYKTADFGQTWTSFVGDLPPNRVIHAVHEDPKNQNLLYVGTEFGLYVTFDSGAHWIEFASNLPRVPVNDFVIHPRDNDLVLATHGRGVWILDDISAVQGLTPQVMSEPAHLFAPRTVAEIRYFNPKAHAGDMIFRGENPAAGALIDYYVQGSGDASISVLDGAGAILAKVPATAKAGLNRAVWNLRLEALPPPPPEQEPGARPAAIPGPLVRPGEYTVRLAIGGRTLDQKVTVVEDPRLQLSAADRQAWTEAQMTVASMYKDAAALVENAGHGGPGSDRLRAARELQTRLVTLYRAIGQYTGRPTADQQAQIQFLRSELQSLRRQQ